MKNKKYLPPVLETERLILRPLTLADKDSIFKWASDLRVSKFMRYSNYNSPDDADFWLNNIYLDEGQLEYGFVWKENKDLIGSGGLIFNPNTNIWTLGYNLRFDMWNKGIATEACKKIIDFARKNYNAKKIESVFAIDNPASGHVMEKLGMKFCEDCEYSKFDGSQTFKAKKYQLDFEK